MGVKEDEILIIGFSDKLVYFDRIEDNPELLNRIFQRIELLKKKTYPLSHSESLELSESEKFLDHELFSNVKLLIVILESIDISELSRVKSFFDQFISKLSFYNPNAPVFIFHPKMNSIPTAQKEGVQKTVNEFFSSGIGKQVKYYSDVEEIIQEISEINSH
jgi:hypothetical protein